MSDTEIKKEFNEFPKIPRWSRDIIITEKLDGTNASIYIGSNGEFYTGSRTRWITPDNDNAGFSAWAHENKEELLQLGEGHHFGEWWGYKVQRQYGLTDRRFSLFNVSKWNTSNIPKCCNVVPTLYVGDNTEAAIDDVLFLLEDVGSIAAKGFMNPEGIVIYHTAAQVAFKKLLHKDTLPKSLL